MDRFKFRGWCRGEIFEIDGVLSDAVDDPEVSVMQSTGLKDKNGKLIYEGDICRNEHGEIGVIRYGNAQFVSVFVPPYDWDAMAKYDGMLGDNQEIIGNIHENPELMGGE